MPINRNRPQKSTNNGPEKQKLHPRNPHRSQYNFRELTSSTRELARFVFVNDHKNETVDFTNPDAVKALNKALLKHFYKIQYWDIPPGYLCPPIPGRADYIHYLADLLADTGKIPNGEEVTGLDIGTGANCVYPIIGHQTYGWHFIGTDVDPKALRSAQEIIDRNTALAPSIGFRLQPSATDIFTGIMQPAEKFDFTMCNPPFHASPSEALAGTQRKWKNLGQDDMKRKQALNFGGQNAELWYPGGELAFITKMIEQSVPFGRQCLWFTTLVSKKTTLPRLYQTLRNVKAHNVKTIEMAQGQKISRILAWSFMNPEEQNQWKQERWKV